MNKSLLSRPHNGLRLFVGWIMIVSFIVKLGLAIANIVRLHGKFFFDYSTADYMINFRSGFVRRGIYGELLLQFRELTGISVEWPILVVCWIAFLFVFFFLIRKAKTRGVEWWIILSPLACGFLVYILRKDFLLYALLIGILCLIKNSDSSGLRNVGVGLLIICGMLIHEAFIFWTLPVVALLLWRDKRLRILNACIATALCLIFLFLCLSKGNAENASVIFNSWKNMEMIPARWEDAGALEALRWQLIPTFKYHLYCNYHSDTFYWFTGLLRLLTMLFTYILLTNYFFMFNKKQKGDYKDERNIASGLFIVILIGLIPMFTILSNDWGRDYQYLGITFILTLLSFPTSRIKEGLPEGLLRIISRFNDSLYRILVPTTGLIVLILLFLGIAPFDFMPFEAFKQSPVGSILTFCSDLAYIAVHSLR